MKKKFSIYILGIMLISIVFIPSCSVDEEIQDTLTTDAIQNDPGILPSLLAPPLASVRGLWFRERIWGLQETTSDAAMFPTRASDWYDGGVWEENYFHTWTPTHRDVIATWNALNSAISRANTALLSIGEFQEGEEGFLQVYRAQAIFLRSFFEYNLIDIYGKYPVRNPYSDDFTVLPDIYEREAGFYRTVSNVKSILDDMKVRVGDANTLDYELAAYGEPNRDAGLMLLAKMYLNKEVYTGVSGYDSCLIYLDELIATGHYDLSADYYNMFLPDNHNNYMAADDEAIFVGVLDDNDDYGIDDQVMWVKPHFHYGQTFGGTQPNNWNGGCATEDYLNNVWVAGTDTAVDDRWKDGRFYNEFAVNLGFNYGQQYDVNGDSLFDRNDNPLNYTFEAPFADATEYQGVRALKYPPRTQPVSTSRAANDFLIWRYADVLLMRAECLLRTGQGGADAIVNDIRTARNAPTLGTVGLQEVLDERGRELYWEGHRRQDLIRFGQFILPKTNKPDASPATARLLPVPQDAIDGSGGKLTQNPGYTN